MKELPADLLKLFNGFRASRILLSAVELDLFSALKGGATAKTAARRIRGDVRGVSILLHALATLGLVRKSGGRFFNSRAAAEFLAAGGKSDWRLGLGHNFGLWRSWSDLTEVIRRGKPRKRPSKRNKQETESFIGLMNIFGLLRGPNLVKAARILGAQTALDIGGGSGAYSIEMAKRNRSLHVTLLDQPQVLPITRRNVRKAGLLGRFEFRAGDLTKDAFGSGFDVALISSISHMLSPKENIDLFRRARRALRPGGRLLLHDFILNEDRTGPLHAAMFAVNMLVNTRGGNSYSFGDYRSWLRKAGFRTFSFRRLSGQSDLIIAR